MTRYTVTRLGPFFVVRLRYPNGVLVELRAYNLAGINAIVDAVVSDSL